MARGDERMKRAYTVELRSAVIEKLDDEIVDAFSKALHADRRLGGPIPSADLALRVLDLRTGLDATSPVDALEIAASSFARAVRRAVPGETAIVDASVWLDIEGVDSPDELLSGAEVAKFLGHTRQYVQQLA